MGLFDHPQPGTVFLAAAFGELAAGLTLVGAVVIGGAQPNGALVWLVVGAQVIAAALLVAGGISLLLGHGRRMLIAGGVLDLVVCGAYLLYLAADEPALVWVPFIFVGLVAVSLVLASLPVTRDHLATVLPATGRDLRPSLGADLGS
jgi:hypothetical protein